MAMLQNHPVTHAAPSAEQAQLEQLLENAKAVDLSGIDWDQVPNHPLREDEVRILTYMMDVESHTIVYLKELLATPAVKDPKIQAFLSCWAYEEYFHGHALRRFLSAYGIPYTAARTAEIQERVTLLTRLRGVGQKLLAAWAGERFIGVHMAWGATNELTTAEAYLRLSRKTDHPILKELLNRIMKDERRHFAFYFQEARQRLADPKTAWLTSNLIRRFFDPVGADIRSQDEVDMVGVAVFGDAEGEAIVASIDRRIGTLPGLEGFTGVMDSLVRSRRRLAG